VILAEEDVEVSDDVLEFFAWAQFVSNIACAWSDAVGDAQTVEMRRWFNPWCWGTSRTTWETLLRPTWDDDYSHGGWDTHIGIDLVEEVPLHVAFPQQSRSRHFGQWLGVHQDPSKHGSQEMPESFLSHRPTASWALA
jgi:hypothetical protein